MSKPIKIMTFFIDENNYGQRLQNYSLQEYLKENFSHDVSTYVLKRYMHKNRDVAFKHFVDFEKSHMNTEVIDNACQIDDPNCIYVLGSDQIFATFAFDRIDYFTLSHLNTPNKITYAASCGTDNFRKLTPQTMGFWRKIKNLPYLSFRERGNVNCFPNAQWHIDPVLLHDADWWGRIAKKPTQLEIPEKFTVSMFVNPRHSGVNPIEEANRLSTGEVKNINLLDYKFSIEEFIWLFQNCDTIHTTSYHGFVFGIVFNKKLHAYSTNVFRISNLINELGIQIENDYFVSNYDEVNKKLVLERERSYQYLKNAIEKCENNEFIAQSRNMFNKYELCAYCKNQSERNLSTSGGACARLAEMTFYKSGVVYGAAYTRDFKKVHQIPVYSMNDYNKFIIGSKYSYCEPTKFDELKSKLDAGQFVTYIGCPCQIVALTKFLGHEYANLLKVELLCSGTSDSNRLRRFVEELEFKYDKKVIDLNMRYNHSLQPIIMFEDGQKICLTGINAYEYFINSCRRTSCKSCNLHMGSECSDLTIGDFWGHYNNGRVQDERFKPELGTNYIFVNTQRGETAIKEIVNKLEVIKL